MDIEIGDRIVAKNRGRTIRGNVRAKNGNNLHVMMDGRMYLISIDDLISVNGKKHSD